MFTHELHVFRNGRYISKCYDVAASLEDMYTRIGVRVAADAITHGGLSYEDAIRIGRTVENMLRADGTAHVQFDDANGVTTRVEFADNVGCYIGSYGLMLTYNVLPFMHDVAAA